MFGISKYVLTNNITRISESVYWCLIRSHLYLLGDVSRNCTLKKKKHKNKKLKKQYTGRILIWNWKLNYNCKKSNCPVMYFQFQQNIITQQIVHPFTFTVSFHYNIISANIRLYIHSIAVCRNFVHSIRDLSHILSDLVLYIIQNWNCPQKLNCRKK